MALKLEFTPELVLAIALIIALFTMVLAPFN